MLCYTYLRIIPKAERGRRYSHHSIVFFVCTPHSLWIQLPAKCSLRLHCSATLPFPMARQGLGFSHVRPGIWHLACRQQLKTTITTGDTRACAGNRQPQTLTPGHDIFLMSRHGKVYCGLVLACSMPGIIWRTVSSRTLSIRKNEEPGGSSSAPYGVDFSPNIRYPANLSLRILSPEVAMKAGCGTSWEGAGEGPAGRLASRLRTGRGGRRGHARRGGCLARSAAARAASTRASRTTRDARHVSMQHVVTYSGSFVSIHGAYAPGGKQARQAVRQVGAVPRVSVRA